MCSYRTKVDFIKVNRFIALRKKKFVSITFLNKLIIKIFNLIDESLEIYFHISMYLDLKPTQIPTVTRTDAQNK
jgi:hypothetical protein